jgi:hypothetical protein
LPSLLLFVRLCPFPFHAALCHAHLFPIPSCPLTQSKATKNPDRSAVQNITLNQNRKTRKSQIAHPDQTSEPINSSPPPQNNPPPQNLQPNHNRHHHLPPLRPPRPRLNNQRSPAPRVRNRGQIVALRDDRRAEPALLQNRRRGVVSSGCASDVYGRGLLLLGGRPGCGRGGRDVLGC